MKKSTWIQGIVLLGLLLIVIGLSRLERNAAIVKIVKETETLQTEKEIVKIPEESDCIRVLIRSDDFVSVSHQKVSIKCLKDTKVSTDGLEKRYEAGSEFCFLDDGTIEDGTVLCFSGLEENGAFQLTGLRRGYDNPVYEGKLEIHKTEKGYWVINELALEEYLLKVVPSEMPAYYPLEALKAQAVCARTYALRQLHSPRMEEGIPADIDDSVGYQVYNNQASSPSTTQAVRDTEGMVLLQEGELKETLYYSTSCGIDLTRDLSLEAVFCAFLSAENEQDHEREEPWYRWNTYFSAGELQKRVEENGAAEIGTWKELVLGSREESGRLLELTVKGTKGEKTIIGEYQIRKFLNPVNCVVTLSNGEEAPKLGLLPSAFFYLVPVYEENNLLGYQVIGGGYGHGNGMSQNGAKNMAKEGKSFEEILRYYYGEIELYERNGTADPAIFKKDP